MNNEEAIDAWRNLSRALSLFDDPVDVDECIAATNIILDDGEFTVELAQLMIECEGRISDYLDECYLDEELVEEFNDILQTLENIVYKRAEEYTGRRLDSTYAITSYAEKEERSEFPAIQQRFDEEVLPHVREHYEQDGEPDFVARSEEFNNWTDSLCKDGEITEWQYENITHPRSCNG